MRLVVIKCLSPIVMAAAAIGALPVSAQGRIGTLERGQYVCELPGDATGQAGVVQEDENFVIVSASRYESKNGAGTYLRRGNTLEMTSGARNGDRYRIVSERYLRKIEEGSPGRLRCVRRN